MKRISLLIILGIAVFLGFSPILNHSFSVAKANINYKDASLQKVKNTQFFQGLFDSKEKCKKIHSKKREMHKCFQRKIKEYIKIRKIKRFCKKKKGEEKKECIIWKYLELSTKTNSNDPLEDSKKERRKNKILSQDKKTTSSDKNEPHKKQKKKIEFNIPMNSPFNRNLTLKINGKSGSKKTNGDIPFSGRITPSGLKQLLGQNIPLSSNQELEATGILNHEKASHNKIKISGKFNISLNKMNIPGVSSTKGIMAQNGYILIDNRGIKIEAQVGASGGIGAISGVELGTGLKITGFFSGNDDDWYLNFHSDGKSVMKILGFKLTNKGYTANIKIYPKGLDIDGSLRDTKISGKVNQFGVNLSGTTNIDTHLSGASNFTNTVTDGAICGYKKVTDVAKCGFDTVKDSTKCGTKKVTDSVICGFKTVTSTTKCGSKYVTSGAKCGYDYIKDGTKCGWDFLSGLFGGKKAKSCKVAKKCKVAQSCKIAKTCKVAKSCKQPKTCDDLSKPKTCKPISNLGDYLGKIHGQLTLSIKEKVLENKDSTKLYGKIVGEYCFGGKCYGLNEKASTVRSINPLKICFPNKVFNVLPKALRNDPEICIEL